MKKKSFLALLAALTMACTLGTACAEGALTLDGTVQPGQTLTLLAPYSGVVGDYDAEAGDEVKADEALFAISATEIRADFDGTVTAVFAQAGDSAAYVQARYGALGYLEREELYVGECSITGASSDNENKLVHPGEHVYIRSSNDSDRKGEAIVTSVSGKDYQLEVTYVDDLRYNEQIRVYRESDFDSDSCIGTGKLSRIDPDAVTAEGYVLAVHVKDGQTVSRGDLLFTVVGDQLEDMQGGDGSVSLPQDGVLLSVLCESGAQIAKDAPMATYCPAGEMKVVCSVDEDDLALIEIGAQATVTLDAYEGQPMKGEVVKIARAANENGEYDVTVALEASELTRIGMSATVAL